MHLRDMISRVHIYYKCKISRDIEINCSELVIGVDGLDFIFLSFDHLISES